MSTDDFVLQVPAHLRAMSRFVPTHPTAAGKSVAGSGALTMLASNENPLGPGPLARRAVVLPEASIGRYPDSTAVMLKNRLAKSFDVTTGHVVLGNGSDEIISLLSLALLEPGSSAVYSQYAFDVYRLVVNARAATGLVVPAKDYSTDLEGLLAAIQPNTRIVFVANPNNPTGTWHDAKTILSFVERVPKEVVILLDEAYDDYLEPADRSPAAQWLSNHQNLVITRTFSKAHGLAALRVGFGLMDPRLAAVLETLRSPFNINTVAQAAALAAIDDHEHIERTRKLNMEQRAYLAAELDRRGVMTVPSRGNFLAINVGDAGRVAEDLSRRGVMVRPLTNYKMPEWLRVTTGTRQQMDIFLGEFDKIR